MLSSVVFTFLLFKFEIKVSTSQKLPEAFRTTCGRQVYQPLISTGDKKWRILGGREATPNSWPWLVSIHEANGGGHFCGGTLIRRDSSDQSDLVLTAAHCMLKNKAWRSTKTLVAIFGVHSQSKIGFSQERLSVREYFVHGQYSSTKSINDLAILKLDRPVKFTATIMPVCLPSPVDTVSSSSTCFVAGWGNVIGLNNRGGIPDVLHQLKTPILNNDVCSAKTVWDTYFNSKYMQCAGYLNGAMNFCSGDSGGPLMCLSTNGQWIQFGVTSFVSGNGCDTPNKPGIFSKLNNDNANWIQQIIKSV